MLFLNVVPWSYLVLFARVILFYCLVVVQFSSKWKDSHLVMEEMIAVLFCGQVVTSVDVLSACWTITYMNKIV